MILLLLACAPSLPLTDTAAPPPLLVEATCPPAGSIALERLGEPLTLVRCAEADGGYWCEPVPYALGRDFVTVPCDGGTIRVVWGM